jgi:hypothetical protein
MKESEDLKKKSYKRVMIKDASREDLGNNVQVLGYVKKGSESESILLNDNTGEIEVVIKNLEFPFQENHLINVFAEVKPTMEGERKLIAHFFQNMEGLNFDHYKKLYEMKKELI